MIRPPVRHPLPAVIGAVSALMCVGAVYAGLHGVRTAHLPVPPAAERQTKGLMIGVAGLTKNTTASTWNDQTGIRASLAVSYISMNKHINKNTFLWIEKQAAGAKPVIEILPEGKGLSLASVVAGHHDGWLKALRAEITEPVVVAFAPEANGNWYPYSLDPPEFRAAWRHVYGILGTHDITWMWQMSQHERVGAYWPGARYVNWVGIDGYFRERRNTFSSLFDRTFATVKRLTMHHPLPVLLSETAAGPDTRVQAADIAELFREATADHLIAVVWFDVNQDYLGDQPIHQNWYLKPGTAAMEAFQTAAREYLNSSRSTARKKRSAK